uniref:INO80 complex subunit B-like conserved region domain-containing protein n=1 Tax=Leptobrachium leishanense TaxID=445787 RepID=A0A8C5QWT0_9ANUR
MQWVVLGYIGRHIRYGVQQGIHCCLCVCPPGDEDDVTSHGNHKKKHKKHKKHKKKHHQEGAGLTLHGDTSKQQHRHPESSPKTAHKQHESPPKPQLKLKIKLGGQVLGTKSVPTFTVIPELPDSPSPLMVVDEDEEPLEGVPIEQYRAWLDEDSNLDPLPSLVGVPEQDEESRWLDALERGELDINGDLKRETDESLLTARQNQEDGQQGQVEGRRQNGKQKLPKEMTRRLKGKHKTRAEHQNEDTSRNPINPNYGMHRR